MKGFWIGALAISVGAITTQQNGSKQVTYADHIEPMIRAKCLPCHGATRVAPFDFSTYESVASRTELIRTELLSRNMPPVWCRSDYGPIAEVAPLTDQELVDFQIWTQTKMPKGNVHPIPKNHLPTEKPNHVYRFRVPEMVKAEAVPYWRVYSVPLTGSGSFDGFDVIPDNPQVIRNATVAVVPKGYSIPKETVASMDLPGKYLVGSWSPGYRRWQLPTGLTRKFEAGSRLVVQVHFRPTGKPERASFAVRTYRQNRTATRQPSWITLQKKPLFIDANTAPVFELKYRVQSDMNLLTLLPEARFYAGKIELNYEVPGEVSRKVFEITRWDPYWIGNFSFPSPIQLKKGSTLTAKFYYSNDETCRSNEGRTIVPISDGPTAGDEICRLHLLVGPSNSR